MSTKPEIIEVAESVMEEIRTITSKDDGPQFMIPRLFYRNDNGELCKIIEKKKDGVVVSSEKVFICRAFPVISRKLIHVEHSETFLELSWRIDGASYSEIVPALSTATRSEMLKLANRGLPVNDGNVRDLIQFLDGFQRLNDIPISPVIERIGYIAKGDEKVFIHPLDAGSVEIRPNDIGEKQTLAGFSEKGTSAEWMENVFPAVKDNPEALVTTVASFASTIAEDLTLDPTIIDLCGRTSGGKTTALKIAASIHGIPSMLINEWNATPVSIERKNALLNNFPAFYDDTMKADQKKLEKIIYTYSGGRSKGRGSVDGSQKELSWRNFMISTGESSLLDYTEAGGAGARVIALTEPPFKEKGGAFFRQIHQAIADYHGRIGLEFVQKWQEQKHDFIGLHEVYVKQFEGLAEQNNVLTRIARPYAAIVLTAHLLNDFFDADIDLDLFTGLFEKMKIENKAVDKPLQWMDEILSELESTPSLVWYENGFEPHGQAAAFFNKGNLYLSKSYLKKRIGPDVMAIRKQWREDGLTQTHKDKGYPADYRSFSHDGTTKSGILVYPETLQRLGYDFKKPIRS